MADFADTFILPFMLLAIRIIAEQTGFGGSFLLEFRLALYCLNAYIAVHFGVVGGPLVEETQVSRRLVHCDVR